MGFPCRVDLFNRPGRILPELEGLPFRKDTFLPVTNAETQIFWGFCLFPCCSLRNWWNLLPFLGDSESFIGSPCEKIMVSFREKPQPNLETFSSVFSQNRPAELARFLTRILSIDGKILGSTKKNAMIVGICLAPSDLYSCSQNKLLYIPYWCQLCSFTWG